jgi:hypothetical protein
MNKFCFSEESRREMDVDETLIKQLLNSLKVVSNQANKSSENDKNNKNVKIS